MMIRKSFLVCPAETYFFILNIYWSYLHTGITREPLVVWFYMHSHPLLPFTFHHTGKITKHFFWFPVLLRVANWTQLWLMRHKKGLQQGSGKAYFIHSSLLSALIIATMVQPGITDADPHIPEQNTTSGHLPLDFLLLRKSKPHQSWGTLTQGFLCWNLKTHPFNTHTIWSHWKFKYLFHLITPCILTERKYFHKLLQLAGKIYSHFQLSTI